MNDFVRIQTTQLLNQLSDVELVNYIDVAQSEKIKKIALDILLSRQKQKVKCKEPQIDFRETA